jgi:hypothetical protein
LIFGRTDLLHKSAENNLFQVQLKLPLTAWSKPLLWMTSLWLLV